MNPAPDEDLLPSYSIFYTLNAQCYFQRTVTHFHRAIFILLCFKGISLSSVIRLNITHSPHQIGGSILFSARRKSSVGYFLNENGCIWAGHYTYCAESSAQGRILKDKNHFKERLIYLKISTIQDQSENNSLSEEDKTYLSEEAVFCRFVLLCQILLPPIKQWLLQFDNEKFNQLNNILLMCTPTPTLNLPLQ